MRQDPIQTASAALTQILHRSLGITVKEGNKSYRSLKKPNPVYLPDDYEDSSDSDSETINVRSCQRDIAAFEERLESSSKNDICQSPGKQTSDYERFSVDWSSNVSELDDLPRREHTVQGVYHRLTNIRLVKMNIQELDKTFAINLAHLKTIDLSQNKLNTLHHVPSSVDNLMVYENNLTSISQKVLQSPQLAHLAVGYNAIKTLPTFKTSTLVSLDVSYNALETLSQVVEGIKGVHTLKHLFLQGNPLALHPHYRCYVLQSVPQVVLLDDIPIDEDEWNTVSIVEVPFDVDWLALQVFVQPLGLPELPIPNEAAEGVEMSYVATYEWPGVFELQRFSLTTEEKTLVFSPTTALHQLPTAAVRDAMIFGALTISIWLEGTTILEDGERCLAKTHHDPLQLKYSFSFSDILQQHRLTIDENCTVMTLEQSQKIPKGFFPEDSLEEWNEKPIDVFLRMERKPNVVYDEDRDHLE